MGQYRLWLEFTCQIGINLSYAQYGKQLTIYIPFITIIIALTKDAKGVYLFNKEF
jgi:hypothetical protein